MKKLERTAFETSRASEYFDARQLSTLTGVARGEFASVCLKELIDNALDACETERVSPEIGVVVASEKFDYGGDTEEHGLIRLTIADNGPGMPPELIGKILNFETRTSDKAAYRSPTRGAQGNALKTVLGIPYALGYRGPVVITACGTRHTITPKVDPAGHVRIAHAVEDVPDTEGTRISLAIPRLDEDWSEQDFDPFHWVRSFAAFNPHASFSYLGKSGPYEGSKMYKSTREKTKKYVPSEPTSAHWYSADSLKTLIYNHIAHALSGGRDLPLGEFVRQFQGLARTAKAKSVCAQMPDYKHISDFDEADGGVAVLLEAMQEESKPPRHSAFGSVGKEHFETFFNSVYDVEEFKYKKAEGTLPSGLPFTFEFALAILDSPGHLYTAINFSPTFGDPLEGTALAGPKFKAHGIRGFLSQGHALPKSDRAWYYSPANVAVAAHIVTPAPIFLDRGKTRLNMEGA